MFQKNNQNKQILPWINNGLLDVNQGFPVDALIGSSLLWVELIK